jgi:hypothetical protein
VIVSARDYKMTKFLIRSPFPFFRPRFGKIGKFTSPHAQNFRTVNLNPPYETMILQFHALNHFFHFFLRDKRKIMGKN